jgi:protein FAM50
MGPNATVSVAPKVMTKSALLREAQTREQLRKEFLTMQEIVKGTEILIPLSSTTGRIYLEASAKSRRGLHLGVLGQE